MKAEGTKVIVENRKARHEYEILEDFEAGIVLTGTEVKSLRQGKANLKESFARVKNGEIWLIGMHISPYKEGNRYNPDALRPRKLLLHRSEIRKLSAKVAQDGLTLVPLKLYFKRGLCKCSLGLARGRKLYDKRENLKKREADRQVRQSFRH